MTAPSTTPQAERAAKAFIAKLKELCPDMEGWEDASEKDKQLAITCMEAAIAECHIEDLVEALRWYASEEAYGTEGLPDDTVYDRMRRKERVLYDRGQRAREVLSRLDGKPTEGK
jgi:hypothetical protein